VTYVKNPLIRWLLRHSYGQGGGVAIPSPQVDSFSMPQGKFPAGVGEALHHLSQRYGTWSASRVDIDWCFLIGGPGNGKSEALKTLAHMLGIQLPARTIGQPVPRAIPLEWPKNVQFLSSGLGLAFVNDASIPRNDPFGAGAPGSLFQDLCDGLGFLSGDVPLALFVNVNRGILVEEAGALEGSHPSLASESGVRAAAMIRWLADPPMPDLSAGSSLVETVVAIDPNKPFYGQFRVPLGGSKAQRSLVVHAVFLDVLSLLEPRPGGDRPAVDLSSDKPIAMPYQTIGRLVSTDITRANTTAGELIHSIANAVLWEDGGCKDSQTGELCKAHAICPFAQNARWLQDDSLKNRLLDTLRAVSYTHLTLPTICSV